MKSCVWIFDLRRDYAGLAELLPRTKLIDLSTAKWNPLIPPKGVPYHVWFSSFCGKVAEHLQLGIAGREFLSMHLNKMYEEHFLPKKRWPTIKDLIVYFEVLVCTSIDEKGYKARVLEKLRAFYNSCKYMLDCESGFNITKLHDDGCNVVFTLDWASKHICDLLASILMDFVYYRRKFTDDTDWHRLFFLLDEQRHLLRERRFEGGGSATDLELLLSRSRRFNMYYLVLEQAPTRLSDVVTSSVRLKLCFNTQAQQVQETARLMGLNNDQAGELRNLKVGECIATLGGPRWPTPIKLQTPKYPRDVIGLSKEKFEKLCIESTRDLQIDVTPRYLGYENSMIAIANRLRDPNRLDMKQKLVLKTVAKGPELKNGLQDKTALTDAMLRTATRKLINIGYVEEAGEVGNKKKVYAITDKGKEKAAEMGVKVAVYKSGPIHELVLRETILSISESIEGCSFQRTGIEFNGVQMDGLVSLPGNRGWRLGIQAICSNNYRREANCIKKLSEVEALDWILAVCLNGTMKKSLEKHLKDVFGGHIHGKIKVIDFEKMCDNKFDWNGEFKS